MSVLYLSYTGLTEPLGQSQVYQYLQKLSNDHTIYLVTYEKKTDWLNMTRREAVWRAVKENGIHWIPLRYHKTPTMIATTYDLTVGFVVALYLFFVLKYALSMQEATLFLLSLMHSRRY